jgi:hypothetical protein
MVRRDINGLDRNQYYVDRRSGYARRRDNNEYVQSALGSIVIPIFERHGFTWGGHLINDPPHFQADPTENGYRTMADAIRASQDYYTNCIERR